MDEKECVLCHGMWPLDRFRGDENECFRCRVRTIGVAFAGGKEQFHSQTLKEFATQTIREAKANGYDPVPVGSPHFAGGVSGQMDKLASKVASKAAVSQETRV